MVVNLVSPVHINIRDRCINGSNISKLIPGCALEQQIRMAATVSVGLRNGAVRGPVEGEAVAIGRVDKIRPLHAALRHPVIVTNIKPEPVACAAEPGHVGYMAIVNQAVCRVGHSKGVLVRAKRRLFPAYPRPRDTGVLNALQLNHPGVFRRGVGVVKRVG